jgi:putative ABC transport system permease protein
MLHFTLRAIGARRRRLLLTVLVVTAGVAMVTGALVFTDTIHASLRRLYAGAGQGAQLTVAGRHEIVGDPSTAPSLPAGLVARISRLPGVAAAAGQVLDTATIVGRDGRPIPAGRLPTLALSTLPRPFEGLRLLRGRPPHGPHQVMLDAGTARRQGLHLGQTVQIGTGQPAAGFSISGIGDLGSGAGTEQPFVAFTLPTAQALYGRGAAVDQVAIAVARGATPAAVASELEPLLPAELVVRGRRGQVDFEVRQVGTRLASLDHGLLALAVVAALVAALLIFNTFAVGATARARELAVLRAIGATRGQVLRSALFEALSAGVLGAVIGAALGPLVALAMHALAAPSGGLPGGSLVVGLRALGIGAGVGVAIVLLAAASSALRGLRLAPLEALRLAGAPASGRRASRVRATLAPALTAGGLGVILLAAGPQADRLRWSAAGCALVIAGALVAAPLLVRGLVGPLSRPLEWRRGIVSRLAREQMVASPGRGAAGASTLTVGLALVVLLTAYAGGLRAAVHQAIGRSLLGDVGIQSHDGTTPIPASTVRVAATLPGLTGLSSLQTAEARLGRAGSVQVNGVDPTSWPSVYRFDWVVGSTGAFASLGVGDILLEQDTARALGARVGDSVTLGTGSGQRVKATVRGIYRDPGLLPGAVTAAGWFARLFHQPRLQDVFVRVSDLPAALSTLNTGLRQFPGVVARSQAQLTAVAEHRAAGVVDLYYALLGLSLALALVGIAGTLSLSVHERTRELGVLRALGMTREQARGLVLDESVVTAAVGWIAGIALGLVLSWAVTRALSPEGFVFAVPWAGVGLAVLAGVLAGLVAAVPSARRVARLDVLVAIAHE